jgi:hypothetical protein
MTNFATGCIYSYDAAHPIGGTTFTEDDAPNFTGSFYSLTKGLVERVRYCYSSVNHSMLLWYLWYLTLSGYDYIIDGS